MELPDEILEPILDEAVSGNERFAQLRRFACVNRQWSHICQARLFRSVTVGDEGHCYLRLMYFSRNAKLGQHVRELKLHQVGTLVQASLSWMGDVFANTRVVTLSAGPQARGINAPEFPMFLSRMNQLETLTLWYTSSAGLSSRSIQLRPVAASTASNPRHALPVIWRLPSFIHGGSSFRGYRSIPRPPRGGCAESRRVCGSCRVLAAVQRPLANQDDHIWVARRSRQSR
jgi:hypothetical protein